MLFGDQKAAGKRQKAEDGAERQAGAAQSLCAVPPPLPAPVQPEFPHPFRNCIVLGLMLAEWWESKDGKRVFLSEEEAQAACGASGFSQKVGKMSKSKRNYREPNEIFDRYGADALRWYFFANQPPWSSIRYSEQAIKDSIPEFLLRLWNVYSFFTIYANIDGFDPAALLADAPAGAGPPQPGGDPLQLRTAPLELRTADLAAARHFRPVAERSELDRWILSELAGLVGSVIERMDAYDNYTACGRITDFVDALSNWYVRRSRDRFWSADKHDPDKLDAYWTLYECLITTCKLIAPFVPFVAEAMWQNLARAAFGPRVLESVHLCDFPEPQAAAVDQTLSARMRLAREIVSLGLSARMAARLKVRQPLAKVEIILADRTHQPWLEQHRELMAKELNVKSVEFAAQADLYITYTVLPDLKRLGPKLGKRLPALKAALSKADAPALLAQLERDKAVTLTLADGPVTLDSQDLQIRLQAKDGWAAAQGPASVVVLSTDVTPELLAEGAARELIHAVQNARRDTACQYTDRIVIGLVSDDAELIAAARQFADYIQAETLGLRLVFEPLPGVEPITIKIGPSAAQLWIKVVSESSAPHTTPVPRAALRIAVLISGGGTTLRNLLDRIAAEALGVKIALVISSNPQAAGLAFAAAAQIPTAVIERRAYPDEAAFSLAVFQACRVAAVDLVVMGGFLKHVLIPGDFENRVVNIHPALIPNFCGHGFYGHRVHEAVLAAGATESGCTVHFVDNFYDHGPIILQRSVPVLPGDTPDVLAARVFAAECEAYPEALRLIAAGMVSVEGGNVQVRDSDSG